MVRSLLKILTTFKGLLIGHRPNHDSNPAYFPKDLDLFNLRTDYKVS